MENRVLLELILGTQRFRDLDLLFKNGIACDYGGHKIGYDGLGFLRFEIGHAHSGNMSPSRAKYFQEWFINPQTEGDVDGFLKFKEEREDVKIAREDQELDLSRKADFFLESPKIEAVLYGLRGGRRFRMHYGQGYEGQSEQNYIALLAGIFRNNSPETMQVVRRNCLEAMKGNGKISFKDYARHLFLKAFETEDTDYLKRAEEDNTSYIEQFTDELFLAICDDAREHSEHKFRTSIVVKS